MDGGAAPHDAVRALRPPIFWKEADAVAGSLARWPARRIEAALARVLTAETGIKAAGSPGERLGHQAIAAIAAEDR
jgi:DNA polymerase-3 subunit delta